MEIHSFSDKSNFQTSRAVFSLLKFGYFSLYQLRTRVVKNEKEPRHVLVVALKRTPAFDQLYETFRDESKAHYEKRLEEEAAAAAAKSTTEETKAEGGATESP